MNKRFLALLLTLCMVLAFGAVAAFANDDTPGVDNGTTQSTDQEPAAKDTGDATQPGDQKDSVEKGDTVTPSEAKIGEQSYGTLEAAVAAVAEGNTITLQTDVTVEKNLEFSQSFGFTLDLNGKTLTGPNTGYTISNSKNNGIKKDSGKIIIKNGTITAAAPSSATIRNYGNMDLEEVNVNSGYIAVKSEEQTTLTLEACTLNSKETGLQNWGDCTATDTIINSDIAGIMTLSYLNNSSTTVLKDLSVNALINLDSGRYDKSSAKQTVTIDGGAYTGDMRISAGTEATIKNGAKVRNIKVSNDATYILGGKDYDSTGNSTLTIDDSAKEVETGTITAAIQVGNVYYSALNGAIAVAENKATIKMTGDVVEDVVVPAEKEITLDLNGYTLDNRDNHTITNNGTLTVIDSSDKKTGVVKNAGVTILANAGTTTLAAGKFNGALFGAEGSGALAITGGHYTDDPEAYVEAATYGVALSQEKGYIYNVVPKADAPAVPVKPVVADPVLPANLDDVKDIPDEKKEGALAVAKSVETPDIAVEAAAEARKLTDTTLNAATAALEEAITVGEDAKVTVFVQTYLDIQPTKVEGNVTTLDITPKYQLVASTATKAEDIKTGENGKNAVVYGDAKPLTVKDPVTITVTLAEKPAPGSYVKHVKDNGDSYYYPLAISDKTVTFENPNGFSTFALPVVAPSVEVTFIKNDKTTETKTLTGQSKALPKDGKSGYNFKGWEFSGKVDGTVEKISGTFTEVTGNLLDALNGKTEITATPVFSRKSSGSSGGSSNSATTTTYNVALEQGSNGKVTANHSNAEKGDTITLTVTANEGYELDKLTATDSDDDTVKLSEQSATKYTFTMPASKVTVKATFKATGEEKPATGMAFTDVKTGDWYAEAVKYVYDKGMMNGVSDTTFAPQTATTRGMIVTILYRLEGKPAAANAGFTDVAAGQYYADAVAWANANGIVNGYGNNKFGPDDSITREQLAATLYRYATYKKYDTTAKTELTAFADAGEVHSWATEALQWNVAKGLVNGRTATTLAPTGTATRAEVAKMLMNFMENIK